MDRDLTVIYEIKDLKKRLQITTEALEKIANHKMGSVDKVYLIHQCDGFQFVAREALTKLKRK